MNDIQSLSEIDILNRKEFIDKIISTVEYHSKNNLKTSFSIQGNWGCGKSWILDRVFEKLYDIQDEKIAGGRYCVFRYNAWKYDYYNEPLVSLLISLKEQFNSENSILFKSQQAKENFETVKKMIAKNLLNSIEILQKTSLFSIIDSMTFHIPRCVCLGAKIKKDFEKYKEDIKNQIRQYDPHYDLNQLMNSLINGLNKISTEKTIVVIVDELDRCLPEHAIKVLERMHHISQNVGNIQFIYGIDKTQIEKNINEIFGIDYKSDRIKKYLSKFITFGLQVPQTEYTENIRIKYPSLFKSFAQVNTCNFDLVTKINTIFSIVNPRTLEQIINKTILTNGILNQNNEMLDNSILVFELFYAVALENNFDFSNYRINKYKQNEPLKLEYVVGINSPIIDVFNKLILPNPIFYNSYYPPQQQNILRTDYVDKKEKSIIESSIVFYYEGIKGVSQFRFEDREVLSEMTKNLDYLKQFCSYYKSLDM